MNKIFSCFDYYPHISSPQIPMFSILCVIFFIHSCLATDAVSADEVITIWNAVGNSSETLIDGDLRTDDTVPIHNDSPLIASNWKQKWHLIATLVVPWMTLVGFLFYQLFH